MAGQDALVLDARGLDRLKESAGRDPKGAARRAAVQFEAMFMEMVLKSMRAAVPESGMLDGPGSDLYKGMLDSQFAKTLSGQRGGLGDLIAQQLLRAGQPSAAAEPKRADAAGVKDIVGLPAGIAQRAAAAFAHAAAERSAGSARDAAVQLAPMPMLGVEPAARQDAVKDYQTAFVNRTWAAARVAERTTGVPASFVLGQAALETGWGRYEIKHPDGRSAHNLFGIKADARWSGPVVESKTTEYVGGRPIRRVERFRAYANDAEAFADWAGLMMKNPRYQAVVQSKGDLPAFTQGLQRAGYATDPAYADKLQRTIQQALRVRRLDT